MPRNAWLLCSSMIYIFKLFMDISFASYRISGGGERVVASGGVAVGEGIVVDAGRGMVVGGFV